MTKYADRWLTLLSKQNTNASSEMTTFLTSSEEAKMLVAVRIEEGEELASLVPTVVDHY